MNEMIERVAKALRRRRLGDAVWDEMDENERNTWESAWDSLDGWDRARLLADAKAAIAAMREPTDEQYYALCATDKMWREMNSELVWKTYIDAALKDG